MIIAVDTGGTKTLVAGFNTRGEPGREHKFETPKDPYEYIQKLLEILHANYKPDKIDAIVVAVPGTIRDNKVIWCGNLPWENVDIAHAIKPHYDHVPVFVENDANLAGLSEAKALKPTPPLVLYLTVSTGIGSGIIVNGKLLPELSGSEAGHMLIWKNDRKYEWEDFASGSAIHKLYRKYAYDIESKTAWEEIGENIGKGLSALIPALQPDTIVIGGSIGSHFDNYSKDLRTWLKRQLPVGIRLPRIVQAKHPQEAVIYGCYYYGVHRLSE
jgi:predicted NBD/HSP70 family sugar kinase